MGSFSPIVFPTPVPIGAPVPLPFNPAIYGYGPAATRSAEPAAMPPAPVQSPPLATPPHDSPVRKKAIFFPDLQFQKERVIEMNARQRAGYNLRHYTVDLAQAVAKGWRGDPDFSFSDFLLTSKIPYFMGGLALTSLFAMGGDKQAAARQGMGVLMYIAGAWAGNKAIDTLVKHRYGVDFNQKFMKYDGTIENVFTSPTFSRYDLIPAKDLAVMQRKMGIPQYVIAPRQAIKGTIQDLIPADRTSRAILANVIAAVAAGYLARSLAWNRILGGFKDIPLALSPSANPNTTFWNRLANATRIALSDVRAVAADKLMANPREASPALRRGVLALLGLAALYSVARVLTIGQHKQWERPGDGFAPVKDARRTNTTFSQFREHQDARYVTALDALASSGGRTP